MKNIILVLGYITVPQIIAQIHASNENKRNYCAFFKWVKVPIRYLKNLQQFRAQFSIGSKVTELGFELLPII